MALDFASKSIDQLKTWAENYRNYKKTDDPTYALIVEELNKRCVIVFDIMKTVAFIRERARERKFLHYGEIAECHGYEWDRARHPLNEHLGCVVQYGKHKGWPMLSAVVVNKENLETGEMAESTLAGFLNAAYLYGYDVQDERAFLAEQQEACFEWARK
ncbi:MAG: hypothetical protein R3C70_07055 [Geminicoccaceae bacterium]